ncbi:MAG: iron-containing alcohol dehydrogenase [Oscillospiraceae bacterium]|nr:iron-containing alcohol dehydrogenase [Oscillospiraceae bacterium]
MSNFRWSNPVTVYFGPEQFKELGKVVASYGKRCLMTYGGGSVKRTGLYDKVMGYLNEEGVTVFEKGGVQPNPKISHIREAVAMCKENDIEVLLAVGGGSTIDATKCIAAGACVDFDPWDFIEKHIVPEKALPIVVVLTASATGSEMNSGGVISNEFTNDKASVRGPVLYPKASFLNPELTYTVPRNQTAAGSFDIMCHILEGWFTLNPPMDMLDEIQKVVIKTVIKYAPVALDKPDDLEARENLMWASSWAMNGFMSSGFGGGGPSNHPMEHQLSAYYDITHGVGLAILFPRWLRYCLSEKTVSRYVTYGVDIWGIDPDQDPFAIAEQSIQKTEEFCFKTLGIPSTLTELGIGEEHFQEMADKACGARGAINGFIKLEPKDVVEIYKMCL